MPSDDNQIQIPPSFIALYIEPGRTRPSASRDAIAERYDLCEDMAQMLVDPAQATLHGMGITEADVLERCHRGLLEGASGVSAPEAAWVVHRLAELLGWAWSGPAI
jgi:hypothetical protein